MKLQLFQELFNLNQAFDQVTRGLERMEKVPLFRSEQLRHARAEVESARVDANREFFENFDDLVENDARWAYRFRRDYDRKIKDPDDIYLEIKQREETRKKKGLPSRVVLLPGWEMGDEERYDEERAKKRKHAAEKRRKATKKPKPKAPKPPQRPAILAQTDAEQTAERKADL